MAITATRQAEELLKDALKELEAPKGSVLTGVQKLARAARILQDEDSRIWCEIQLGNPKYTGPLKNFWEKQLNGIVAKAILNNAEEQKGANESSPKRSQTKRKPDTKKAQEDLEKFSKYIKSLNELGLKKEVHFTSEEVFLKSSEAGGGYMNIGVIEEMYADIIRTKKGNLGDQYYQVNLAEHIGYVRRVAHEKATLLYNKLAFTNTPQTSIDILKAEVDDKLLDIAPELAEKLMVAFKAVASSNPEEWSHALTTCRRFIEDFADALHPPTEELINGRRVGRKEYINRIWAFMDQAIESDRNRDLAKAHVDYLGAYVEKIHKLTNKGVHAEVTHIEAVKAVFHTYLMVADILDYLRRDESHKPQKLNIHTASLDELESVLPIKRDLAKEIIKLRVQLGVLHLEDLEKIKGIGPKIISIAKEQLSFDPVASERS